MDDKSEKFSLNRLREKIAVGDNSKVFAAKYSSLTYNEKKAWVITAAIIREEKKGLEIAQKRQERRSKTSGYSLRLTKEEMRMMREDVVAQEVAHGCENEESETFELNDLFLSD
ncbi:hypothetical protein CTI12_AA044860 [Artemisia annua]|uniref:Uncharacterized protein n=1 Tax=Artemisia annua TaxID=35608 RepID=A0A2U1QCY6_ARTAN|nr:hypothetical protein CTI12_AA044860 [Artemisia annua]